MAVDQISAIGRGASLLRWLVIIFRRGQYCGLLLFVVNEDIVDAFRAAALVLRVAAHSLVYSKTIGHVVTLNHIASLVRMVLAAL